MIIQRSQSINLLDGIEQLSQSKDKIITFLDHHNINSSVECEIEIVDLLNAWCKEKSRNNDMARSILTLLEVVTILINEHSDNYEDKLRSRITMEEAAKLNDAGMVTEILRGLRSIIEST